MTAVITLTTAGLDTGPFNLYSNVDGYLSAFAIDVTRTELLAGYSVSMPDFTTIVKVMSVGVCMNSLEVIVPPITCYNFLPTDSYYLLDYIFKNNTSYFYGAFDGYIENDIVTSYKNLIKLNSDLTVDTSFNVGTGFNEILYTGSAITEQADGKIIVTGTFTTYQGITHNRIIRLNTDGSIDTSFITGTGFNNFTQVPDIDSNGSIIVTGIFDQYNGSSSPRIARLLSTGILDSSFVIGSGFNNTTTDVLVQADNSMFVLGYFNSFNGVSIAPCIAKLLENGSLDPSYDVGVGITPTGTDLANYFTRIPDSTSFFISGYIESYKGTPCPHIIKLLENGDIDSSFNPGTGFNDIVYLTNIIWNDKILVEGFFTEYNGTPTNYIVILNMDGSIYFTFDSVYINPVVIGNNLFAAEYSGCLQLLHTFVEI